MFPSSCEQTTVQLQLFSNYMEHWVQLACQYVGGSFWFQHFCDMLHHPRRIRCHLSTPHRTSKWGNSQIVTETIALHSRQCCTKSMPTKRYLQMRLLQSYSPCVPTLCQPWSCSILEFPSTVDESLSVVSTTHQCWWHAFLHCRLQAFFLHINVWEPSTSRSCPVVRLVWFFCS